MKNWLRARTIPDIPDDSQDRKQAIVKATRQLDAVRSRDSEVTSVAESLSRHTERNHFAERLEWAYGIRK